MLKLFVKAPAGNGYTTPFAMKRVDEHVNNFGAFFCAPEGIPIQESDGTWEVRILTDATFIPKKLLTEYYGLEIVREENL